jgi:hypothetical protein
MELSYDIFTEAFLDKISEYDFIEMNEEDRTANVDRYMKRAIAGFRKVCKYDLSSTINDETREFGIDVSDEDVDEIVDIISEGMVFQWLKPRVYKQDLLANVLNTKDFSMYSPSELLNRIKELYKETEKRYTQMIREYSYNHNDLTELHI